MGYKNPIQLHKTKSFQVREYQKQFIEEYTGDNEMFPHGNPNEWLRKELDKLMKKNGVWKEEYKR